MARMIGALAVVLTILTALGASVGCGSISAADQKLDESMGEYRSALEEVEKLDLSTASQEQVEAARAELQERWAEVERRAGEAGRDLDPRLERAQAEIDEALGQAKEGLGAGLEEARETVRTALDEARSAVENAWSALKELF